MLDLSVPGVVPVPACVSAARHAAPSPQHGRFAARNNCFISSYFPQPANYTLLARAAGTPETKLESVCFPKYSPEKV